MARDVKYPNKLVIQRRHTMKITFDELVDCYYI